MPGPEDGRIEKLQSNWTALGQPVSSVKGVGKSFLRHLHNLEIYTVEDLLYHFPRRYLDRRKLSKLSEVRIGEETTVVGTVRSTDLKRTSRRKSVLSVAIYDGTAYLFLSLYHGKSPDAATLANENERESEFVIRAPFDTWRQVIEGKLDPIQGMMTRKLKLSGNMMKIMRYPKAAKEIVDCCALVPTDFGS